MERLMVKRFGLVIFSLSVFTLATADEPARVLQFQSSFLRVELAPNQPAFKVLSIDSLGKKKLEKNPLRPPAVPTKTYELRRAGQRFEYRPADAPESVPAWSFEFSDRRIQMTSTFSATNPPPSILFDINPFVSRGTLLGLFNDDGTIRIPAVLHLPDMGTFRITSTPAKGLGLGYDALRHKDKKEIGR